MQHIEKKDRVSDQVDVGGTASTALQTGQRAAWRRRRSSNKHDSGGGRSDEHRVR